MMNVRYKRNVMQQRSRVRVPRSNGVAFARLPFLPAPRQVERSGVVRGVRASRSYVTTRPCAHVRTRREINVTPLHDDYNPSTRARARHYARPQRDYELLIKKLAGRAMIAVLMPRARAPLRPLVTRISSS